MSGIVVNAETSNDKNVSVDQEPEDKIEIILSKDSVTLDGKGDTVSIDVSIMENNKVLENPDDEIKFTSSDSDVAYEAFGFIYAVGKGKTIITAEYKNVKK